MKRILYLFALTLFLASCARVDGDCPQPIRISLTEYNFNADGGSVTITFSPAWLSSASFSNVYGLPITENDRVDVVRDDSRRLIEVNTDWFMIRIGDETDEKLTTSEKLIVEVQPNTSGNRRRISIGLQQVNCFVDIVLTQSAE